MEIVEATEATPALVEAFATLIPQLSSSNPPPTAAELAEIIAAPATSLLLAVEDDGTILGGLTLAIFRIPTGLRAWIEDVVVDDRARGKGVGRRSTAGPSSWPRRPAPPRSISPRGPAGRRPTASTSASASWRTTNVYRYEL
ncbi:MAG: GNAT family N-acetyltransferase [Acidimicrobiales bacterium]